MDNKTHKKKIDEEGRTRLPLEGPMLELMPDAFDYYVKKIRSADVQSFSYALQEYVSSIKFDLGEGWELEGVNFYYDTESERLYCCTNDKALFIEEGCTVFNFNEYSTSDFCDAIEQNHIRKSTTVAQCPAAGTEGRDPSAVSSNESVKNDILDDKLPWELFPIVSMEPVVEVYKAGAKKYGPNRWRNLERGFERYQAAAMRHLVEYLKGNRYDAETGCQHLAQFVWNGIAMLDYDMRGLGLIPAEPKEKPSEKSGREEVISFDKSDGETD